MKLLDRHILQRFLSTFFFVVLILLSVITVIDLTDKMDKFAKAGVSGTQIAEYYLDYVYWIGGFITPITIFIATVYVCAQMAGRTEIIAILSNGISFRRFLLPFFIGALIVATISFILNGWVIPNASKSRLAFETQYLKGKFYYEKRNLHIQAAPGIYLYLQSYNNTSNIGYHFTMEKFEQNRLVEKLTANRIEWDSVKQKWSLREYKIKKIDQLFVSPSQPESIPGFETSNKTALTRDSVISGLSLDTALVINPKEFQSEDRKFDGMTITELNEYIRTLRSRGSAGIEPYEVEKYTRYTSPFTIFILVFMGAIVSSRKSRGGTGLQIALGFALSFIFILFFTLFRTFAEAGTTPPQISVWVPNIVFAIISLVMYKYVPR
jgi:lipopolysaccharide export system permease protein